MRFRDRGDRMKSSFIPTHKMAYDRGVWLPVMRIGDDWVTRSGKKFPIAEDDAISVKPIASRAADARARKLKK